MATKFHRKLFPFLTSSSNLPPPCANFCDPTCSNFDECYLLPDPDLIPPNPSSPPPPPPGHEPIPVTAAAIVVIVVLVSFFLLVSYCAIFTRWTRLRTRRRNPHAYPESEVEDMDGGDEPVDNPFWFISTVGLQQAVIDSIKVIKYRKDEGLFEGRDCSVCLNEFEEGESLRLLPKCNHAFHVECIDTWLRYHTNCPLCRANIAPDPGGPHLGPNDPSFGHSRRAQVAHVGDLDTNDVESGGARTGDGDDGLEDNRGETGEGSRLQVRRSASMHFCPGWNSVGPNLQMNPKFGSFRMSGGSSSSSSCRAAGGSSSQVKRSYSWSERVFGSARFQKRNSDPEGSS